MSLALKKRQLALIKKSRSRNGDAIPIIFQDNHHINTKIIMFIITSIAHIALYIVFKFEKARELNENLST